MENRTLTLYSRRQCHLCEDMHSALEPWRTRFGFAVEVVEIDGDPALEGRFGARVPVLTEGGREICHYFLDEAALRIHFLGGAVGS